MEAPRIPNEQYPYEPTVDVQVRIPNKPGTEWTRIDCATCGSRVGRVIDGERVFESGPKFEEPHTLRDCFIVLRDEVRDR